MAFLMNPIISNELNLFAQELQYFLSPVVLQDIAKQVGFVQRSSKYQANELIALCVWLSQEIASTSLTLCSQLEASTGVLMSSEGLNQRFNPATVAFLREVFTSLLTQKLCTNQSLSAHIISTFNRIRILDATVFQLPDHFATDYQGSGGVVIRQAFLSIKIEGISSFSTRIIIIKRNSKLCEVAYPFHLLYH
ncbi:hypothetical protein SRABI133_04158 [Peribacillus simplex]|uniref:IS4 family transposase n=1 Tax=Peribacillus simplex TaxID=1478 RepID=A0A9W4L5E3_9BACI|nr:hypothetical protein SRABI133_04158 [Peribacillus simplex]